MLTLFTSKSTGFLHSLLLCMLVTCSSNGWAGPDNLRFQRLSLEQGLSQETINTIFQDRYGFMWFGTQEGLNRYDGYGFKVFSHNDRVSSSLANDWVRTIAEDVNGTLWVGTAGGGISLLERDTMSFRHLRHDHLDNKSLSDNNIRVLFSDSQGTMWVGTDKGLNRYHADTGRFTRFKLSHQLIEGASDTLINSIAESPSGDLWVAAGDRGVFRIDLRTRQIEHIHKSSEGLLSLTTDVVRKVMIDSNNRVWVGTHDKGVSLISADRKRIRHFYIDKDTNPGLGSNRVRDIFEDKNGSVFLATDEGLNRYLAESERFSLIKHENGNPFSLSGNKLTALFQDRGGVFWVGSYSGLNKWNTATANFSHYRVMLNHPSSLSNNGVNAFDQDEQGNIWIGTYGGLNRLDTFTEHVSHFLHSREDDTSIDSDKVMAVKVDDQRNQVYVGTMDKGLEVMDLKTGAFTHLSHDSQNPDSISANGVTVIREASDGQYWVGTFGGGLNLFDPDSKRFVQYQHDPQDPDSISDNRIMNILTDDAGLLWLGTWRSGISIFNPGTGRAEHVRHNKEDQFSLGSDVVLVMHEDRERNIWVGTRGGGLNKLTAANRKAGRFEFERFTRNEGLPSNSVYGILEDNQGMLWISTNRGLSKLDPQSKALLNYDSSHGLQGNEFNFGAYHAARDGQFFFGGTNGFTAFYPELIKPNEHVPPVVLTNFLRLNESFNPHSQLRGAEAIQISYQDYLIAFEFAGLDFASPNNNRYSYKLEGLDDDWIEAGDLRRATYTNLPAGNYRFKVKASNNDGVWNEQGVDLALTVLPAPWYSWWAYLAYTLLGLSLAALIVRSYLSKLRKEAQYRAKLEEEVKIRTSELRQANEQLLNASVTDQLTGLHNRRYLANIIDTECAKLLREVEQQSRKGAQDAQTCPRLFCLMFDLDGFKPINDTYGHDAGDQIICQISELLKSVCRKSDTVIRWGGDEFLIVGRIEDMQEVNILAERLRNEIVAKGFDIGLKHKLHLSCSIGYSLYPFSHSFPDSLSWEQVQVIADRALYHSKDAGRNFWSGIVATDKQPTVSLMNTLLTSLDQVLEEGYVNLVEAANQTQTVVNHPVLSSKAPALDEG